jgi:hypothetical protein
MKVLTSFVMVLCLLGTVQTTEAREPVLVKGVSNTICGVTGCVKSAVSKTVDTAVRVVSAPVRAVQQQACRCRCVRRARFAPSHNQILSPPVVKPVHLNSNIVYPLYVSNNTIQTIN